MLAVQSQRTDSIARLRTEAESLRALAAASRLDLIPEPYPSLRALLWSMCPVNRQFWGILASTGLLSLGAPFWFNLLKSLSSLRPALAARREG
jgi:hypothetical protein